MEAESLPQFREVHQQAGEQRGGVEEGREAKEVPPTGESLAGQGELGGEVRADSAHQKQQGHQVLQLGIL